MPDQLARLSGDRCRRKYVNNDVPSFVCQSMWPHSYALCDKVERSAQIIHHSQLAAEEQFSDNA